MEYQDIIRATLFFATIALLVVGYIYTQKRAPQPRYLYRGNKYIMTRAETDLYKKLIQILPNHVICPQVRLSSLFNHKIKGQNWTAALAHINQKSVDFVILNKSDLSVAFVIECDDPTHEREERKKRDSDVNLIFNDSAIALVRITNSLYKSPEKIKNDIKKQLDISKHKAYNIDYKI